MSLSDWLLQTSARRCGLALLIVASLPAAAAAQSEIVLNPSEPSVRAGKWSVVSDGSAIGGRAIRHADGGASKLSTPLASPANYFELTFDAVAGTPYRIWLRGRADNDHYANDSIFIQFSGSVTSSGSATWRIGTTSAAEMNLEECSGCGLKGWRWEDNGWGKGILGPLVYFAATGRQTLRIQTREDGLSLDQIVLSASKYLTTAPTTSLTTTTSSSTTAATEITLNPSAPAVRSGKWTVVSDGSAFGGKAIRHADEGASKLSAALASPANYFELTFDAVAGTPYRLWLHGRADSDHYANDSVFIQFSGSVTSSGSATWRIGTTSATEVNLEECNGCGLNGWRWEDNGWGVGVLGPLVYFATTGPQRMRVQTREDGLAIDRVLLSPATYLKTAPTTTATTTTTTTTTTTSSTSTATSSPTTNILKVMTWNTAHGKGTDGVYNIDRFIPHIVKSGANVVCLQEVERYVSGYGNEDQPARYAAMLKAATGKTWYHTFAHRTGGTKGQGNAILSIFPFEATDSYLLSYSRSVARAQILVNGIRVNIFSTHLDANSASYRTTQMKELTRWAATFPEQRILTGDFNAWPGAGEIVNMTSGHYDAWAVAKASGTAIAYAGNEAGNTRNSRIDYVFYSKGATRLVLKAAQVFDTRDSKGIMPSDHRPVMATFEVR